jgi:hypothetical protein
MDFRKMHDGFSVLKPGVFAGSGNLTTQIELPTTSLFKKSEFSG